MLYMANWGSRQLMFRLPSGVLGLESANAYCRPLIVQDCLSFSSEGAHAILKVDFHDTGGKRPLSRRGSTICTKSTAAARA